jgi:phenylpropionate dioxygenase-like ring-hydroxylating dioxygenase large terminal subunit
VSTASAVRAALAQHRGGHALPQAFALSPAIHAHELDTADVDRDAYGLHRAAVAEVGGLVFVWFGPDPAAIDDSRAISHRHWRPGALTGRAWLT